MEPPDRKKRIRIALAGLALALVLMGFFFWPILRDLNRDRQNSGNHSNAPLLIFGGFFLVMALAVVISVVQGIRKMAKLESTPPPPREDKPWLKRPDWAAGKIKSTAGAQVKLFAIMAVAFCGIGGLAAFAALPKELHNGNYKALLVLIFPAIGIGFLIAIVRVFRARRRFGDCFFELAQIPAPLGGSLDGMIQTGTRLRLEHGLHLKFSCIRRVVTGSGKNESTQETVLWQAEKVFKPEADLPEPEPGHSGIPVFFKLPADQPECYACGRESVSWRLEAKAKMSGPDFSATFDVPVFQVAGAAVAEEVNEPDPTASLQMPVEEIRRDENSRIQVNDVPGGREFFFPAARNLGTTFFMTLFMLVFNGAAVFMYRAHAPILFPIVFGLVGVLLVLGTFNLWFKSSRITINSTNVQFTKRWLIFSRTRDFSSGDYARFATKMGMQSGSTIFTDIKLVRLGADADFADKMKKFEGGQQVNQVAMERFRQAAGPSGVTVANSIANAAEAEWLVKEMNKALGRRV
ncbi:MAG TPA: hypothetical protein VIK62_00360 [Verrucomicrobiae bacterium]